MGSTTDILRYAEESDAKEFIIGTESSIVSHLQFACPEKRFYPLSRECVCHNMKMTTLPDVLMAVRGIGGEEILLSDQTIRDARRCIDRMIKSGRLKSRPPRQIGLFMIAFTLVRKTQR